MKIMRKIIEIDEELCDGCGECVPSCAEGAIELVDGKARLVAEKYCDGLGACMGECPNGALSIVEREAEDFDEEAVEAAIKERNEEPPGPTLACGCPSTQVKTFEPYLPDGSQPDSTRGGPGTGDLSLLSHWPVQINLVPPDAPFLKGADLLVAADCAPVAYPGFHRDFVRDRAVMIGCPKFDDIPEYTRKFRDIFKVAGIRSVTVLVMEVPCCSGLPMIVKRAMEAAGKNIPLEVVVVGSRGKILEREKA